MAFIVTEHIKRHDSNCPG